MIIDTHCHLIYEKPENIPGLLSRAKDAGVGVVICACADIDDPHKAIEICDKYENVFCTIGIHPEVLPQNPNINIGYTELLKHPKCVAVGEIGLDYHYGADDRDTQIDLFRRQLEIAATANMPVTVHSRDADDDTIAVLSDFPNIRGVMHCFTGDWNFAKKMLDRGYYFSASGILTFKNAAAIQDVFTRLPADRIIVETDAPYCAPVPYRGKKSEPYMTADTLRFLSALRGTNIERECFNNTIKLYPKIKIKNEY